MPIFKLGLFLAAVFASSPTSSSVNGQNIAGVVSGYPELSSFSAFLDSVGISPGLGETVLAPSNAGFKNYGEDNPQLWDLYQKKEWLLHLREILLWHLVTEGIFTADQIFDGNRARMEVSKGNITIDQRLNTLDGVPREAIFDADIDASDGIVHVMSGVIIPPYMRMSMIEQMLYDQSLRFGFSTMANLAKVVGLDDEIDKIFEEGLTFLVPLNIRFFKAGVDVASLILEENHDYTKDLILSHIIGENFYESTVFAVQHEAGVEQMLVKTWLGTHLWITTIDNELKFQNTKVIVPDQLTRNGYVSVSKGVCKGSDLSSLGPKFLLVHPSLLF
jgi:uncharacterized surface protein with fasciclin (FAS1) repeats